MDELIKTIARNVKIEMAIKDISLSTINKEVFNKDGDYLSRKLKGNVVLHLKDIYELSKYLNIEPYQLLDKNLWKKENKEEGRLNYGSRRICTVDNRNN